MSKLRSFLKRIKKMPLALCILISAILFALLVVTDGGGKYDLTASTLTSKTVIGLGMEKVKDGVFPWPMDVAMGNVFTKEGETASAKGTESAAGETSAEVETAAEDSSLPAEEAALDATLSEAEVAEEGTTEEEVLSEEEADLLKKQENPTYIHADSMPEDVNDPVVGAVDYGNAEQAFLSPEDETYNTDTEGIFAQNGDYYRFTDVEGDYLADALVIGNSRTEGLHGYSTLGGIACFACKEGVSVYNILSQNLNYYTPDGSETSETLEQILSGQTFGKVYISLGINEVGIGNAKQFYEKYREILTLIREKQPDAIIFIEGMMHVSRNRSETSSVFSNKIVVQRNGAVSTLANGHDIFYIDMNSVFCDEDGNLYADATSDGIHPYASEYEKWYEFLLARGITK